MSDIYTTKGRAKEYCPLALNLYKGCNHGCLYCYAPLATKRNRERYHKEIEPTKDTIRKVGKSAHKHRGQEVLLCFTTDPYNSLDRELALTRRALEIFRDNGIIPVVLTKAGMGSVRDFDLISDTGGKYGATLTFINADDSRQWEPEAALPEDRFNALKQAHNAGIRTWASLEPVIDPEQSLEIIRATHDYVDHYKVGKWNYDKKAKKIDWTLFLERAETVLHEHGKSYMIKTDLERYRRPN